MAKTLGTNMDTAHLHNILGIYLQFLPWATYNKSAGRCLLTVSFASLASIGSILLYLFFLLLFVFLKSS